jgi:hypothetical protein
MGNELASEFQSFSGLADDVNRAIDELVSSAASDTPVGELYSDGEAPPPGGAGEDGVSTADSCVSKRNTRSHCSVEKQWKSYWRR